MTEAAVKRYQKGGINQSRGLREVAEILRARFSSVSVVTSMADNDTALSVRFVGDTDNLTERKVLVSSLAECLPPALSILGIRPEKKRDGEAATSSNGAS